MNASCKPFCRVTVTPALRAAEILVFSEGVVIPVGLVWRCGIKRLDRKMAAKPSPGINMLANDCNTPQSPGCAL